MDTETFENSTEPSGEDTLTSLQEDFHASLFPPPGKEEERMTTVFSGRKCCELYGRLSRHGLSLRTFAESLLRGGEWYSTACALRWKKMDLKSSRFVFQLAPLVRPINANGFGLLLTPRATEHEEDQERFVERNGDRTLNAYPTLSSQIVGLLPTMDANDGMRGPAKAYDPKGKSQSMRTVTTCIARMLPTPKSQNANSPVIHGQGGKDLQTTISMLTTPNARDWKDTPGMSMTRKDGRSKIDQVPRQIGASLGLKLQPGFAAWMMGFPEDWTELPFRRGEGKA